MTRKRPRLLETSFRRRDILPDDGTEREAAERIGHSWKNFLKAEALRQHGSDFPLQLLPEQPAERPAKRV